MTPGAPETPEKERAPVGALYLFIPFGEGGDRKPGSVLPHFLPLISRDPQFNQGSICKLFVTFVNISIILVQPDTMALHNGRREVL
jgi:hypothetical protein